MAPKYFPNSPGFTIDTSYRTLESSSRSQENVRTEIKATELLLKVSFSECVTVLRYCVPSSARTQSITWYTCQDHDRFLKLARDIEAAAECDEAIAGEEMTIGMMGTRRERRITKRKRRTLVLKAVMTSQEFSRTPEAIATLAGHFSQSSVQEAEEAAELLETS